MPTTQTTQKSFMLPDDVIFDVRMEAARRGCWPSEVVTEALRGFFAEMSVGSQATESRRESVAAR